MTTYEAPPLDGRELRRTMGRFATGVAVITTQHNGQRHGMTVNSLTSVSLDPPLLLVCFSRGSRTARAVSEAARFGVNVLSARQEAISNHFARRGEDHFADVPLDEGPLGVPLISNAIAHIVCTVASETDAGDHVVVLGNIVDIRHREGLPLCFFSGTYGDLHDRGNPAEFWYF
jgi:flavin reductase (DIM6/NTAB) family NADH-FMN oxidoreductase RutF